MWAEPLASWTDMKARASGLWHADRTKVRPSVYEVANISEPDTNAVKNKVRGQRNTKFHEFAGRFTQRPNGSCVYHEFFEQTATKCGAPCAQAGNEQGQASAASIMAGSLTLHDGISNKSFLINTGAEVSVVPATDQERQGAPLKRELVAANGSCISMSTGKRNCDCMSAPEHTSGKFLVADVRRVPTSGRTFLTHSSLLVNLRNNQLVHPEELNSTPLQRGLSTGPESPVLLSPPTANPSPLAKLFAEFPSVTVPNFKFDRPKHTVHHTIETRGQPIRAKARPLPPQKLAAAKSKFCRDGHVRHRSQIEWAMVLAFARGNEEGRKFPDVRGLPPPQYRHDARTVTRFHSSPTSPHDCTEGSSLARWTSSKDITRYR